MCRIKGEKMDKGEKKNRPPVAKSNMEWVWTV